MLQLNRSNKDCTFLASTWADVGMRQLRETVWRDGGGRNLADGSIRPGRVWVSEFDRPDLKPGLGTGVTYGSEQLSIIDVCLDAIRSCDRFILLDTGDYGTTLHSPAGRSSASSFLELELFQAISLQKPTTLIVCGSTGRRSALVQLFQSMVPKGADIVEVRDLIEARAKIREISTGPRTPIPSSSARLWGNSVLADARHTDWNNGRLFEEPLFLAGLPAGDVSLDVDADLAEEYLVAAETQMATDRVLSRVWIAMRALMGTHFSETSDPRLAGLWDRALQRWSYAAAWRGLHGHLMLGMLTASASQAQLRLRLDWPLFDLDAGSMADLYNDLSSAHYSVAGLMTGRRRRFFYERAELYLKEGFKQRPESEHWRLLPQRGSVERRLGRTSESRETFREALEVAEAMGNGGTVALMKAELAQTDVRSGKIRRAFLLIEEALNEVPLDNPVGETARIMRKAVYINLMAGRILNARKIARKLVNSVEAGQAFDQIDRIVKALARF